MTAGAAAAILREKREASRKVNEARHVRLLNRLHAGLAGWTPSATGFVTQPEPRGFGSYARGKQLIAGNCLFAGHLVTSAAGTPLFALDPPSPAFAEETHGHGWLDDLAAVGDLAARRLAQAWVSDWIVRHGDGRGAGWTPDLAGRRSVRWINNALFLLQGSDAEFQQGFFGALTRQAVFLSRRWRAVPPGLPRFEALAGLTCAGLALTGMDRLVASAVGALAGECARNVDAEGGIATRSPEDLLEIFTLLNWTSSALAEAGRMAAPAHLGAIARIAPTLRALRHADGGLARFHGGGRGGDGRLDHALAASGVRGTAAGGLNMGFARISYGRTSVIVDAAAPPRGAASADGHASTLGMEVTSGRRPMIVNCGSGASFGAEWRRAGRATASHSTLGILGYSSSRFGTDGRVEYLTETPSDVRVQKAAGEDGAEFVGAHDGYVATHGLTHMRRLEISSDGRGIVGEDTLAAVNGAQQRRFDRLAPVGVAYAVRFHLHPEVDAALDMGGSAVSLVLRSGEIWVFRHDGVGELSLEPSVYLERGRLQPRPTRQVVLSGVASAYASRLRWTLAKATDTPTTIRDLDRDDPLMPKDQD
jgi:uncharacterized heparinase superfamily protein